MVESEGHVLILLILSFLLIDGLVRTGVEHPVFSIVRLGREEEVQGESFGEDYPGPCSVKSPFDILLLHKEYNVRNTTLKYILKIVELGVCGKRVGVERAINLL